MPTEIQLNILRYTDLVAPSVIDWGPDWVIRRSKSCRKCSDALDSRCCPRRFAAVPLRCDCWRVPVALFQVSHKMREMATQMFFSSNHFRIHMYDPRTPSYCNYDYCTALTGFLEGIPAFAVRYLRFVTCQFPAEIGQELIRGERSVANWYESAALLALLAHPTRMTLGIRITEFGPIYPRRSFSLH